MQKRKLDHTYKILYGLWHKCIAVAQTGKIRLCVAIDFCADIRYYKVYKQTGGDTVATTQRAKTRQLNTKALLAVAVPFAIMAAILMIYGIRYDTNDDATLANLSAGAYGTGLHPVHLNIILSAVMRPLYMLAGDVNWYVIVALILSCLGICAIFYCLMNRLGTVKGLMLGCALMIPFAANFFYAFQYSKTSTLMLTGGLLLITENLDKFNKFTLCGILLCVCGSMTRWESFFAVGGIYAAILLYRFFSFDKKGKINAVITMMAFFAVIFGAEIADRMIYNADPQWKAYVEYNAARTEYSDYKVYLLKGENIFAEDGITDTEFALLDRWDFYDEDRFTTEFVNYLADKVPDKTLKQTVLDTAYTFKTLLYGQSYRYIFLLCLVAVVLCVRKHWGYISAIGTLGVFGGLLTYLLFRGRFTRWVESGLLWAVVTVVLFCLMEAAPKVFSKKGLLAVLLAVACAISLPEYIQLVDTSSYWRQHRIETNDKYDEISADKEHLYLLSSESIDRVAGYDVWNPRGDNYFSNIVCLGGWLSRTPYRDDALNAYGVRRPMVDCVDNPLVYLDSAGVQIIAEYASRQLGVPVYAVKTGPYSAAPYQLKTTQE